MHDSEVRPMAPVHSAQLLQPFFSETPGSTGVSNACTVLHGHGPTLYFHLFSKLRTP